MEGNAPVPGWNAHRHPQEPLRSPNYRFKDVPKCSRDLKGSVLQEIKDRDQFKEAMAEMVLLCTEAIRRSSAGRCSSKPLSLEYIADRLDVDDPCFGYLVRSNEGMLQGFISVTTFTNWQKNFRWDSLHELSFYYDDSDSEDEDNVRHRPRKERRVDRDGSLARELQQTVRLGDPYNEGIVWPRIAEITLLGALGCGKALVQLVIEQLEFQKGTGNANYDYVALQATDNSIPFYESLGFVRVGAVTYQGRESSSTSQEGERSDSPVSTSSEESAATEAMPLGPSSPEKPDALAMASNIVSSPVMIHEVRRAGETPRDIAKRYKIDVWDIIFLNKDIYKDITPGSRLIKGTILHVPMEHKQIEASEQSPTKWFVAKENDTPRKIAKMFGLSCKQLVAANQKRMPELVPASRLREGTRVKVSNLDKHDDICNPYCHWSFPDDSAVEGGEPSYVMIYKLDRKTARNPRKIRSSLAVAVSNYTPPTRLMPRPQPQAVEVEKPCGPKPPPKPLLAIDIFKEHQRELYPELKTKSRKNERILDDKWNQLNAFKQSRYNDVADETRKHYDRAYEQFEVEHSLWQEQCEKLEGVTVVKKNLSLFNKVVKLRDDALEGQDCRYWFVLTYIPDLKWCHLAPMVQDGIFGEERKRSCGRPKWRLVDEKLGKELDISSVYCIPVKSKALRKTVDADKEEWDILDGAGTKTNELKSRDVSTDLAGPVRRIRKHPIRARSAIKPMSGKIVKPIMAAPVQQENIIRKVVASPRRGQTSPLRSPHRRMHSMSPTKRTRSTPQGGLPRLSSKRKAADDLHPPRKARKVSSSGARRSVLQS